MQEHDAWMRYAEYDIKVFELILKSEEPVVPPAIYHAHQCVEKAFKAFLKFKKHQNVPKTHDLKNHY
jgi:HEPN domain-containing protein